MKPTQEQVLQWAREASKGMLSYDAEGEWRLSQTEVAAAFAALAYEAGRADENEDCAKVVELECIGFRNDDEQLSRIAAAIRARRGND